MNDTLRIALSWIHKAVSWLVAIVGFLLLSSINDFKASVQENKQNIAQVVRNQQEIEKEVEAIKSAQMAHYELILQRLDQISNNQERFIGKFDQYDNNIRDFYKTYDLKKK